MAKHWKKPESKQCKCGAIFNRIDYTNDLRWENTKSCPRCRRTKVKQEGKGPKQPGHYEVKNAMIDRFLYGKQN